MKPEINPYDNIIGGLITVRRALIVVAIAVSLSVGIGIGCRLAEPEYPTPTTVDSGRPWKAGLVLTFPNSPSPEAKELLAVAGAVEESGSVFVFKRYDRFNGAQNAALEAALRENAKVTGR